MTVEWIKSNNQKENWEKTIDPIKDSLNVLQSNIKGKTIENMTIEDVTIEDINKLTLSDTQWVSPQGVMKALASLNKINSLLWEKVSLLIKKWDILWIQLALGMEVGAKDSNKNADGVFWRSTLNNIWAWKVTKTNLTPTSKIERDGEMIELAPNIILISNMNDVRKWWWSWDAMFLYSPMPKFTQKFYGNWRVIQQIDATEPQSILQRASEGAHYNVHTIKWNWRYNENGQMVVTYDGEVTQEKFTKEDPGATTQFNQAIEKMSK